MSRDASQEQTLPSFVAGSKLLETALELASDAHQGQTRNDDRSPYIGHPLAVARLLNDSDCDESVIAAALLHDVVEDTKLRIRDVVERFGADVGELVAALTEDESIAAYEERKAAHRDEVEAAGPRAAAIYAADKLANLRDMRSLYAEIGERAAERFSAPSIDVRMRLWRRDVEMAERIVPELPLVGELRDELRAFEGERARSREALPAR